MYYSYYYNPYRAYQPPHKVPSHPPVTSVDQPPIRYFHPGDCAPNFVLEGVVNLEPKTFDLREYKGKWVLLFFYGSNFTFV